MINLMTTAVILFFLIGTLVIVHKEMLESKLEYDRQRDSDKLGHIDELIKRGADINRVVVKENVK